MDKDMIRRLAARLIVDGLRRSAALESEAFRDRRLAGMIAGRDADAMQSAAAAKFAKAARIRQLCGRLAAAHGIGPKRTGRGWRPRPVLMKSIAMVTKEVTHAR